jgi:hypothetical protein
MRNGKVNGTPIFATGKRVDHDLPVKSGLVDNPIAMSFLKRHDFSRAETLPSEKNQIHAGKPRSKSSNNRRSFVILSSR